MGTREKLFRQKLADQIEGLLTKSEKVFTSEKLDNDWLSAMISKTQELNSALTIYQFLHELPENEKLQVEFLELKEEEETANSETETPSYGDEILKEIDEFETQQSEEVFEVVEEVQESVQSTEVVEEAKELEKTEEEIEPKIITEVEPEEVVVKEPNTIEEIKVTKESAPIEKAEIIEEPKVETVISAPKEETTEVIPEEVTEPEAPIEAAVAEKEEVTEKANESEQVEEAPIVKEEEAQKEINDTVASSSPSLADKLSNKTIAKLADSIALNERFLYSNELFNGNMEAFKRALTELDHIASKEDANRYIDKQLRAENNWNMESETVQGFIALVERRFN